MMTTPLVVLAVFAAASGWVNIPGVYTGFTKWVTTRKNPIIEYHPESFDLFALGLGLAAGLLGIGLGYYLYQLQGSAETGDDKIKIEPIWKVLENKYYIDDFYFKFIIDPIKLNMAKAVDAFNTNVIDRFVNGFGQLASFMGAIVYNNIDQNGIDKVLNMSSTGTDSFGGKVKLLQTGRTQQYLMLFLGGVVTISLLILFII